MPKAKLLLKAAMAHPVSRNIMRLVAAARQPQAQAGWMEPIVRNGHRVRLLGEHGGYTRGELRHHVGSYSKRFRLSIAAAHSALDAGRFSVRNASRAAAVISPCRNGPPWRRRDEGSYAPVRVGSPRPAALARGQPRRWPWPTLSVAISVHAA